MRCPKCGYLSFDHLEICRGCRKNITKFSQELSGVVFQCEVPDFLRFEAEEEPEAADAEAAGAEVEETETAADGLGVEEEPEEIAADLQDDTVEFSTDLDPLDMAAAPEEAEQSKEIEFSLPGMAEEDQAEEIAFDLPDEEAIPVADAKESSSVSPAAELGIDMSLDDLGGLELDTDLSAAKAAAPALAAKAKPGGEENELSSLDLDGFDLSGLTSATKEKEEDFSIGELSLEGETSGAEKKGGKTGKTEASAGAATSGLANLALELEGIDFNPNLAAAPAGNAVGKNPPKSKAKTGTALDDFNFDLGELAAGPAKPTPPKPAAPAPGKTAVKKKV